MPLRGLKDYSCLALTQGFPGPLWCVRETILLVWHSANMLAASNVIWRILPRKYPCPPQATRVYARPLGHFPTWCFWLPAGRLKWVLLVVPMFTANDSISLVLKSKTKETNFKRTWILAPDGVWNLSSCFSGPVLVFSTCSNTVWVPQEWGPRWWAQTRGGRVMQRQKLWCQVARGSGYGWLTGECSHVTAARQGASAVRAPPKWFSEGVCA